MLSDADIRENAAYALHFEVASQLIRVTVKSGWLTLTGEVVDEAEKAAAEKAVLYIRGCPRHQELRCCRTPCQAGRKRLGPSRRFRRMNPNRLSR